MEWRTVYRFQLLSLGSWRQCLKGSSLALEMFSDSLGEARSVGWDQQFPKSHVPWFSTILSISWDDWGTSPSSVNGAEGEGSCRSVAREAECCIYRLISWNAQFCNSDLLLATTSKSASWLSNLLNRFNLKPNRNVSIVDICIGVGGWCQCNEPNH
jgi:hypothetical protein